MLEFFLLFGIWKEMAKCLGLLLSLESFTGFCWASLYIDPVTTAAGGDSLLYRYMTTCQARAKVKLKGPNMLPDP